MAQVSANEEGTEVVEVVEVDTGLGLMVHQPYRCSENRRRYVVPAFISILLGPFSISP